MKRKHKKILLNYIFDDDLLDTKDYIENEVSDNISKNPMAYKSIFDKLYTYDYNIIKTIPVYEYDFIADNVFKIKLNKNLYYSNNVNTLFVTLIHYIIKSAIEQNYTDDINLNFIDTSNITSFNNLFTDLTYKGKILMDKWDTSNVKSLVSAFYKSDILLYSDVSMWNVKNVKYINSCFYESSVNCDLSKWTFNKILDSKLLFYHAKLLNFDFYKWPFKNLNKTFSGLTKETFKGDKKRLKNNIELIDTSEIENFSCCFQEYSVTQTLNLNNWDIFNLLKAEDMFLYCKANIINNKWDYTICKNWNILKSPI